MSDESLVKGQMREMRRASGSLTGPIAESSVSSRTFSMADFEGLRGGGRTRVERSAILSK